MCRPWASPATARSRQGIGSNAFVPEGYVPPKGAGLNLAWPSQVIGDYFGAAGIPILRGRDFTAADPRALRWW